VSRLLSSVFVYIYTATRETAFVHAISAAGVAHAVTRACSSGRLDRCGCDRSIEGIGGGTASVGGGGGSAKTATMAPASGSRSKAFQWAGCSDNVAYGTAFSKSFVDSRETRAKGRDGAKTLMNLHNNNAGRKVSGFQVKLEIYTTINAISLGELEYMYHFHKRNAWLVSLRLAQLCSFIASEMQAFSYFCEFPC